MNIVKIIKNGGVGILPTDTLYGLVGQASSPAAIKRIYQLKGRKATQPSIILISSLRDLAQFGIKPDPAMSKILKRLWPGPVSIILDHQAFRLPDQPALIKLLRQTGPLIAPSANPNGAPPATTIGGAKKYFGNQVDFYLDGGRLRGPASVLITLDAKKIELKRPAGGVWIVVGQKLQREFKFKDFRQALAFVNRVGTLAEKDNHHPDIGIFYNRVAIELWTHSAGGITVKDLTLAGQITNLN